KGLPPATAPDYISVEMAHSSADEDLRLLRDLGYTKFKVISQVTRAPAIWPLTGLGYRFPLARRVASKLFAVRQVDGWIFSGNSSGPFGEDTPGSWHSHKRANRLWRYLRDVDGRHAARGLGEWFDIHATR